MAGVLLLAVSGPALALKSDRQQPLEVKADSTDGTLGDGTATLLGNVEIRQGSLLITADSAEVEKVEGRVRRFEFNGQPVHLQQEIEEQGLVRAEASRVEYEVASGIVTLTGAADVVHPQYRVSGEVLEYDMNEQHFKGKGDEDRGRIRIRLDPEVISGSESGSESESESESEPDSTDGAEEPSPPDAG
jgi:lipopolysaccharide export system protein LptA